LLEGKKVNLRVREKEDVDFLYECYNDIDFWGENPFAYDQTPKWYLMKEPDNPPDMHKVIEFKTFIIQKKDGTRIGITWHMVQRPNGSMEIVGFLIPSERGKEYGAEALQLMVDYLFLHRNIVRIQATTNVRNKASQRILERARS
jgi:diamine N-acetyltransferase